MASGFEDHQSDQDAITEREALVDINTDSTPSDQTGIELKPRRKRLSDTHDPTDNSQAASQPQRKRLSDVPRADVEEPAPERPALGVRPRLSMTQTPVAVLDAPDDTAVLQSEEDTPADLQPDKTARTESRPDPVSIEQWIAQLRAGQNLPLAAAGGLLAAVVGAMVWAVVTVATSFQIGWMAVGVGFLVGGAIRMLGRGMDKSFGYLGAGLALFGCLLGNHLTNCMLIAKETGLSATAVLIQIDPTAIPRLMVATFHPLDVLFYGLAVYEGYRLSFRRITETEANTIMGKG